MSARKSAFRYQPDINLSSELVHSLDQEAANVIALSDVVLLKLTEYSTAFNLLASFQANFEKSITAYHGTLLSNEATGATQGSISNYQVFNTFYLQSSDLLNQVVPNVV